jgi:hypothetical protein
MNGAHEMFTSHPDCYGHVKSRCACAVIVTGVVRFEHNSWGSHRAFIWVGKTGGVRDNPKAEG